MHTRALSPPTLPTGSYDALVIGAGFVGLSIANELVNAGMKVLAVDQHRAAGMETSSRNSEVIHAGLYYNHGSLKARLCLEGRELLYDYCTRNAIPFRKRGKLVVATSPKEVPELQKLLLHARGNGVDDLREVSPQEVQRMEPHVRCSAAVHSPSSGVLDTRAFVRSLERTARERGVEFAFGARFLGADARKKSAHHSVHLGSVEHEGERAEVRARFIVNAAGLGAQAVASRINGLDPGLVPPLYLAKGHYFALKSTSESGIKFERLVYPLPRDGGLGIHVTVGVDGSAKFGPNVEWLTPSHKSVAVNGSALRRLSASEAGNRTLSGHDGLGLPTSLPAPFCFRVPEEHRAAFAAAIRTYCPGLRDEDLEASFAGVRPKLVARGNMQAGDFVVQRGGAGGRVVSLFGIESPGLTACLALGKEVGRTLLQM